MPFFVLSRHGAAGCAYSAACQNHYQRHSNGAQPRAPWHAAGRHTHTRKKPNARKTTRSGTPPNCSMAASRGGAEAPRGGGGVRPHAATKCAVYAARVRGRGVEERGGGSPWGAAAPAPPTPSHGSALSLGGLPFCVMGAGGNPSHNGGRAHAAGRDAENSADARPPRGGRQRAPHCTHGAPPAALGAPQGLHPAWLLRAVGEPIECWC